MAITQYQKRTKVRRMSDIERLAREYSKNIQAMTGQYEQSYSDYQKQVAEKMAPYEAQVQRYQSEIMPAFESQASAYKQRLSEYNKKLEASKETLPFSDGLDEYPNRDWKVGISYYVEGMGRVLPATLEKKGWEVVGNNQQGLIQVRRPRPAPFTEKAPEAPQAPIRPEIAEFDTSKFAAAKTEAESTFKREVGERKAARLGAVGRRATRPMLQES